MELGKFSGHCPNGTYLDARSDYAPGRKNPGGVKVFEPGGVGVTTFGTQYDYRSEGPFTYRSTRVVHGTYTNWTVYNHPLEVRLVCTDDYQRAKQRVYP
ncbi:hypothetical protein ACTVZO_39610 [Streptomyces sp. IBSNAI002]|uniref:hypothetical protein n=1 Tax=Streptomyces sp. IBSNAI002 TaxID=3457500 RepID=UPI003FD5A4C1